MPETLGLNSTSSFPGTWDLDFPPKMELDKERDSTSSAPTKPEMILQEAAEGAEN